MKDLVIIGGGNMGLAIAQGVIEKKIYTKNKVMILEKSIERVNFLKKLKYNTSSEIVKSIKENKKVIEIVIIAVKPNDVAELSKNISDYLGKHSIIISIAAGISIKTLVSLLGSKQPIARVMPNTPCQVGEGMSVIAFNKKVKKSQREKVFKIFNSIGKALELSEKQFNLASSINGSGPAYFCFLIECLVKSGVKNGLDYITATKLVNQTAKGTISLLLKKNIKPEILRKSVTSPKGITEAALKVFYKNNFFNIINMGVKAAKVRANELGKSK